MNPLHAQHYADQAVSVSAKVTASDPVAHNTMRLRVEAPQIAQRIVPGQFVMVRLAEFDDPLIGRALALYRACNDDELEVVYIVKGKLTTKLAEVAVGQRVGIWGPLGNGFSTTECDHLIMAAGGIGQTPFLELGAEALGVKSFGQRQCGYARRVTLVYGVRSENLIAGEQDFVEQQIEVDLCTDDGSRGRAQRVPDRLNSLLQSRDKQQNTRVVCCGPEIMMEKTAEVCARHGVACNVSLETPMACGIGICFSCVAKIRQPDGQWDYKRTCVEGPVFDATKVVW